MNLILKTLTLATLLAASPTQSHAAVGMQIIADNDFAVFAGSETSISRLIYQNNVGWPDQLVDLSSFSFDLLEGENTFYLLGLGGGGNENLSGTINDVDISSLYTYDPDTDSFIYSVSQSSDLSSYLSDYFISDGDGGFNVSPTIAEGTYDVSLSEVQTAFTTLTWGAPTPTTGADDVAAQSPNGQGYHFDDSNAVLYRFSAENVGVDAVPEPSTNALLGLAGVGFFLVLRRRMRNA